MCLPSRRGAIRPLALVSEAVRIAVSAPVASSMTAVIVAAVCGVILVTTGQTVAAERDVLARIDDAGTRMVIAIDDQGDAGIDPEAVERIAALSTVEWVIGLGYARDGRNANIGPASDPVPIRALWGTFPEVISINGRMPNVGEGIAGSQAVAALGMTLPVGAVNIGDAEIAIVGGFSATEPLATLNRSILTIPDPDATALVRSLHVLAANPRDVAALSHAVASLLGADDPTAVRFETSATLADVRVAVAGELGRFSRRLVLGALGAGLVLVGLAVYSSVTLRRQDFGRRRALGATRSTIVALVAIHYTLVAAAGIAIGTVVGSYLVTRWTNTPPDGEFTLAVSVLTLLATLVATVPPALVAAYRDPVLVLRVP